VLKAATHILCNMATLRVRLVICSLHQSPREKHKVSELILQMPSGPGLAPLNSPTAGEHQLLSTTQFHKQKLLP